MVEDKKLWDRVLVEMELGMSKANFTTWLKDTCIIKQEDGVVYLSVPNAFVKDNRLYANVKRQFRTPEDLIKALIKDEYITEKMDSIKLKLF